MELRHLRYFAVVAEELTFARAAERLNVSRPPLSQQVRQLEVDLGIKLFVRTKRHLELTSEGKIFAEKARRILFDAEQIEKWALRVGRGEIGEIAIGLSVTHRSSLIHEILTTFVKQNPHIHLTLNTMRPLEQLAGIQNQSLDVGFVWLPLTTLNVRIERIAREPVVVAMSKNNPLAKYKRVPLAALADQKYIAFPRSLNPAWYDFVVGKCLEAGFTLNISHEQSHPHALFALIAANRGLALVISTNRELPAGVTFRELEPPGLYAQMGMAYRREELSPGVGAFVKVVKEVIRSQGSNSDSKPENWPKR